MTPPREPISLREGLGRLRTYVSLFDDQWGTVAAVLVLMLVATAISLLIPLQAGRFVDLMGGGIEKPWGRGLLVLVGLLVAQLIGGFLYRLLSRQLSLRTVTRLRRRLFAHLLVLPSLYHSRQRAGDISSRFTGDVGSIQYILTQGTVTLARAVLTLVGAVILMFRLDSRLTLVVLLLVPATVVLVSFFGRRMQRLSRRMFDELGRLSDHVQEVIGAIRVVKVFTSEPHEMGRFDRRLDLYLQAGIRRAWLSAALESLAQILLWGCLIGVVVYGFVLNSRGQTTQGELVSFMLLAFRVAAPMGTLTGLYSSAQGAIAAAGRLDDVLRVAPELQAPDEPASAIHRRWGEPRPAAITLANVSFGYDDEPRALPVIADISLTIAAGEKVGLVGPSGAGKTTVAGLLMRLFDPQQGELSLDGRPYRDFDPREIRGRMAYVPQEPVLVDATVAENIRFGLTDPGDGDLREAAARAHALDFIEALPDGFDTPVGPRGQRLSGGERQRIALARAFLHDPGVLILDEPTSALDAASEEAVMRALHDLLQGRTAVVVAHRLSLVRELDRILVLDGGRLREQGPHAELLAAGGLYALLHRLQQGE